MNVATQIRNLAQKAPKNHLGLPEGIYRPDLLPAYPTVKSQVEEITDSNTQTSLDGISIDAEDSIDALQSTKAQAPYESSQVPTTQAKTANLDSPLAPSLSLSPLASINSNNVDAMAIYEKDARAAFLQLDYAEGYPTIQGSPFWVQLPYEPVEAFVCFEAYLTQGNKGVRQLYTVAFDERFDKYPERPSAAYLEECFHTYYWGARSKAFDMFFTAHRRKERERMAMDTEDMHYLQGSRLMAICDAYLEANKDELVETMTPKAFLEMFKTAAQIQRISIGLSANGGNQNSNDTPPGASLEVIMRSISQQSRAAIPEENQEEIIENGGNTIQNAGKLSKIMADPKLVQMAQELIIRMNPNTQRDSF